MSWLGWLLLLAALYPVILIVQGIVQFVLWLVERLLPAPSKDRHPHERPHKPPPAAKPARASTAPRLAGPAQPAASPPVMVPQRVRRPSRLLGTLKALRILLVWKGYDYWVACALAEEDHERKIRYLTKALALKPDYLPAWGLKGNALFAQEHYEQALACLEKTCQSHPSPMTWHKMGVCCHHLNRRDEALRYLNKALDACSPQDHHMREETLRMKSLVEYLAAQPRSV